MIFSLNFSLLILILQLAWLNCLSSYWDCRTMSLPQWIHNFTRKMAPRRTNSNTKLKEEIKEYFWTRCKWITWQSTLRHSRKDSKKSCQYFSISLNISDFFQYFHISLSRCQVFWVFLVQLYGCWVLPFSPVLPTFWIYNSH